MKKLILFLLLPFSLFALEDDDYFFADNEGITVTGTVRTSQQISIVEKEQIENSGAGDLANLLHETLGLNIVRYGAYGNQAGINLRGFDSKRVAFLINGVQVNSSLDGKFDINQIDLNSIERIEVIYGGSDFKYNVSGAFGGVVNIITVKKQKSGFRFSASAANTSVMPGVYRSRQGQTQGPHWEDLLDTQNYSASVSYGGEAFSLTANIFANRAENHFLFIDRFNFTRRKDNNEVWDSGLNASFVWELPDLTKLIALTSFNYRESNFPTSGFSANTGHQNDFYTRQNFMIESPRIFHDNLAMEAALSWQFQRRNYTSPANSISIHDQHCITAMNRWSWYIFDKLTFKSGIDYSFLKLDSTEIGNRIRHDGGIYLTAEFKPAKFFLIVPSVKIIFTGSATSESETNSAVVPKLGLLWNVTDNVAIRNNYFRNFKFPDFEELYWGDGIAGGMGGIGNPNLRPEDGWGADIGVSWQITEALLLESTVFAQWIKDSIHWFSGNNGIWQPENVGEAALFGFDGKIGFGIPVSIGPVKKIAVSFSYQYIISYLLSYGYTFNSNKRIPYNPEHTLSCSLGFIWDNGSVTFSGHYESLRYHDTANLTILKPVFLLSAGVNQRLGKDITVFGTLRNILNTSYESFYDYPMPGITLTLGARINLEAK